MGSGNEWLPTFGLEGQVPHVPGMDATPRTSFSPPTPVISIGLELNSASPRAILARREFSMPENRPSWCEFAHALNKLKMAGLNVVPGLSFPKGSLIPI